MEKEAVRPRAGAKSATAFRTISEVSDELDVPQHVLRFWETKFPQVRPLKRGGGRRYYRPDDVALLRKIQRLLYSEGYTIKGVQRLLKDQRQSGGDAEGAEAMAEGLLGSDLGGDGSSGDGAGANDSGAEDLAGDALGDDDGAEGDGGADEAALAEIKGAGQSQPVAQASAASVVPATQPVSTQAVSPPSTAALGIGVSQPFPLLSVIPATAADMPAWLRRELTGLRTELIDLKSVLRKAIR